MFTMLSTLRNVYVSWGVLLMTEMSIVKTLMIYKWSFMAGLDDLFMGKFLLRINSTICLLAHIFRYWLGSMYEAHEFPMLSGIKVLYTVQLYIVTLVYRTFPFDLQENAIERKAVYVVL